MKEKDPSRRDFVSKYAPAAFFGALGLWGGSLLRFTMPTLLPQATKIVKLGMPEDYPPGTTKAFDEDRFMVFSDDEGIYAISTTCTHLGCVVTWSGRDFGCPCHGSRFGKNGEIKAGPAPSALVWHRVQRLPSGQLAVDLSTSVKQGTKEPMYA
jgi:cytochrome b6-f complex iron-sulfur subunit